VTAAGGRGARDAPPRPGVRLAGDAGAEVAEDLLDHGPLCAQATRRSTSVAARAREGVDLDDLLQHRRPPAGSLCRRQLSRGVDRGRRLGLGRLGLTAHSAAVRTPRRDVPRPPAATSVTTD